MNTALRVVQGLLGFALCAGAVLKVVRPRETLLQTKMGWAADFADGPVKLMGLAEVRGAIVDCWVTGILPVLTPVSVGFIASHALARFSTLA